MKGLLHLLLPSIVILAHVFIGTDAQNPCKKDNPCANKGKCKRDKNSEAGFYCKCRKPFFGDMCENGPCDSVRCINGGTCVVRGKHKKATAKCECIPGFLGDRCEIVDDPCSNNPCENDGECTLSAEQGFHCVCNGEFTGDRCQWHADPCSVNPCHNGGECFIDEYSETKYRCNCVQEDPAFVGDTCEIAVDRHGCRANFKYVFLDKTTYDKMPDLFKVEIKPNNLGWPGFFFQNAFNGSSFFLVMQGFDSFHISKTFPEEFYILHVALKVQEVRKVVFDFKRKEKSGKIRTFETEKVKPSVKADFELVETKTVTRGGHRVTKLEISFRRTAGLNNDNGLDKSNQFWMKSLEMHICLPLYLYDQYLL